MKAFVAAVALLLAPLAAHAACSATDFAIKDFKPVPAGARMSLKGTLVNNCASAAAAQIRIDGKDDSGKVLQSKQVWPAGTSNIAPGDSVNFDLGRMFHPDPGMTTFTVSVADVRAW
ncbi:MULTISPECIES: hypothetical protein [Rhodanobacter]|uniref:Uncharacterized protein n=1 Tax=Rhodanobacter hydrolyticus TaxID=2250595 RepID=A0ABW8J8J8_9GAMM|nr:hypothetical protein [Rhodanobacter sp. 7MK24]MBD8881955.1 hypothetical protein [Rhodanobacter sp. 7MK24]